MFRGTYTALITPLRNGQIDEAAFRSLIDEQIEAGVDGIVPCGSTGESATMSHAEHEHLISVAVDHAAGRLKVIAGTGSNNTAEACRLTEYAARAGADGALLISPYYNKPTQKGHVAHYRAVAEAAGIPIIVYNIPGRTGVDITPETIAEMAEVPGIVGLKQANGSVDHTLKVRQLAGPDFLILSGDDTMTLAFIAIGGDGVIGVTPNIVPVRYKAMVDAALADNIAEARAINAELLALMQALMTLETNPIGIKTAMALSGRCTAEMRLPLTPMEDANRRRLETVLADYGLASV
jgi:4-hydroxy-tetrahydrodipicolinate synthase